MKFRKTEGAAPREPGREGGGEKIRRRGVFPFPGSLRRSENVPQSGVNVRGLLRQSENVLRGGISGLEAGLASGPTANVERGGAGRERGGRGREPAGAGGGGQEQPPRWSRLQPKRIVTNSMVIGGVHADRDIVQRLVHIEHATFVMDWERTLYEVRALPEVRASQSGSRPSQDQARARPATLLAGNAAMTPFVDRDAEIIRLTQWYEGSDRVSVMLIHGAGGLGKSRLMQRFSDIVSERPEQPQVWDASPLTEVYAQAAGEEDEADLDSEEPAGILLLVDEADAWSWGKLFMLFRDAAGWRAERLRVLLAARAAGMWWTQLRAELSEQLFGWDELPLPSLGAETMKELAERAGRSQAAALGWPAPSPLPGEVWDQLANSPPLSVELMVLARLHASHTGQPLPATVHAAVEVVLEKELRYWAHMYGTDTQGARKDPSRIRLDPKFMARAVYVATLAGPCGLTEAWQVIALARIGCDQDPQQIVDDHARCYPPTEDNKRLIPLPSCLAEEFLGMLVPDPARATGVLAQDGWATEAPFRILGLMSPQERDTEDQTRRKCIKAGLEPPPQVPTYSPLTFGPQLEPVIRNLVRAASTRPHIAEQQLYPLARRYPKAVVMAGSTARSELENIGTAPPCEVLTALEQAASECNPEDLTEWQAAMEELHRLANQEEPPRDQGSP